MSDKITEHEARISVLETEVEPLRKIPERMAALEATQKTSRWLTLVVVPLATTVLVLLVEVGLHGR